MPVEDAGRGSTVQEREAALAWLEHTARDEHQVARVQAARRPAARRPGPVYRPTRIGAHRKSSATFRTVPPGSDVAAPLPQVQALLRQQQRSLHRSALIDYVLAAETRGAATRTMGDALGELLADITEAARTIGTLLRRPPTGGGLIPDVPVTPTIAGIRTGRDEVLAAAVAFLKKQGKTQINVRISRRRTLSRGH